MMEVTPPENEQWERLRRFGRSVVEQAMRLTTAELWGQARIEAPVDQGRLAGSLQLEQRAWDVWAIVSGVEYAIHVHEGTGIHGPMGRMIEIRPVTAKALFWPGALHPVTRVLNPGQQPNPFMVRAWSNTEDRVPEFIETAIRNASN